MRNPKSSESKIWFVSLSVFSLLILIFATLRFLHRSDQAVNTNQDSPALLRSADTNHTISSPATRMPIALSPPPVPTPLNLHKEISNRLNPTPRPIDLGYEKDFVFTGNASVSTAQLREFVRLLDGQDRNEDLKKLINKINEVYRAYGFLQAKVTAEPDRSDPAKISISIDEGKQYRWGDIEATSEILPQSTIMTMFHVEKGWPANLADMRNMLHAYVANFQEQGYMDCAFTPQMSFNDKTGEVSLKVDVSEGPRYIVRDVSLDSPNAQSVFSKLQGQTFSPSLYLSLLTQTGLTDKDIRLEFDRSRGEISILGSAIKP